MLRNRFPCRYLFRAGALVLLMLACGSTVAPPAAAANGTIKIVAVDANAVRIHGACYSLTTGTGTVSGCDVGSTGGLDGVAVLSLPPGTYSVALIRVTPGYQRPGTKTATVLAGQQTTTTFTHQPGASTLRIATKDLISEAFVSGACYRAATYFACDDADGAADGVIRFGGMAAGTFNALQKPALAGYYLNSAIKEVTFTASDTTKSLVWFMEKAPASAAISIRTMTNRGGNVVKGACFDLAVGRVTRTACDGDDGVLDGMTSFTAVRPGSYRLTLKNAAALGYMEIDTQTIDKLDGQLFSITINLRRLIYF